MEDELLTVDRVAQIVRLHPRTVRRFIREGRLNAKKIGKQWRIRQNDLDTLAGMGTSDPAAARARKIEGIQVSVVVDICVTGDEEATRIFNSVLAAVMAKGPEYGVVRYESVYLKEKQKARLMLWGDATFIGNLLITVHKVSLATG
jgi:excisionase family DNA binding protein